jgi:ArsR family transcriptional regulator, arsenate/arsenite/antimonite-responsive transcriptional repressor
MKKLTGIANLFKSLSDENRLKIIQMVRKGDLKCLLNKNCGCEDRTCIKDLSKHLKIGLPTVSHHIKELTRSGIIKTEKKGRWSYLQINPKYLSNLNNFLNTLIDNK